MNVLFVTTRSPYAAAATGGAESSIRLLAEHFAMRDHKVVYISQSRSWFPLGPKEVLRDHGVRELTIKTLRGDRRLQLIRRLNSGRFAGSVENAIAANEVQVAYAFYELENLQALLQARSVFGTPKIVMRMAGLRWYEQCLTHPHLIGEYERAFNEVDAVNFIHESLRQMVEEKLKRIGMQVSFRHTFSGDIGSSVEPGLPSNTESHPDAPFKLVMVARFIEYAKRQDLLVEAAALLDPGTHVTLELIGSGPRRAQIEERIEELGIRHRVVTRPFMPQPQLWSHLRRADLLCHACDHEGLGKAIIESMALGLPVLASNVPPINRYIVDGENGFLVENTPHAWARRIAILAGQQSALRAASLLAIDYVRREHNPSSNIVKFEDAFRELLAPAR